MLEKRYFLLTALFIAFVIASCGGKAVVTSNNEALKDPKTSIAYQLELVKAGDMEGLRGCLTNRVRDNVTKEGVDKAKTNSVNYTIEDLYESAEMGEADGKKTAKVKMKNGRTLTTLVETDGKWLADTVWFK